jgi:hypothetical protein
MDLDVTEFTAMVAANYGCVVFLTASWTQKKWHSSDAGVAAYRPRLVVTYTTGSTGTLLRVNMNAQMQSLNGGMN